MSTALSGGAHLFVYALFLPIKNSINVPMNIPIATPKIGPILAKSQSFPDSLPLCFLKVRTFVRPVLEKQVFSPSVTPSV